VSGPDRIDWLSVIAKGLTAARPTAAATNAGFLYYATDTSKLWRSSGALWENLALNAAPSAHASTHAPGGTDSLPWGAIFGRGLSSARPVASASNSGYLYFSTDTSTIEQSTGTTWVVYGGSGGSGGGEVNTGNNVGASGIGVYDSKSGVILQFRSILAGDGIDVQLTENGEIRIVNTRTTGGLSGVSNVATDGARVHKETVNGDAKMRRLQAGSNIRITEGTDAVVIEAQLPAGADIVDDGLITEAVTTDADDGSLE